MVADFMTKPASAVSQLLAARNEPRLCQSSIDTIVSQECVGVYIVQTVHRAVDGRSMDRLHLEVSFH